MMYNNFFGFSENPFGFNADPKFLLTERHQAALSAMLYGIKEKRGFIAIIGEEGTGKTTLICSLLKELGEDTVLVYLCKANSSFEHILKNILGDLKISIDNHTKPQLLNILEQCLADKLASGYTVSLILDEAHNLPFQILSELCMLSNLETNKEKLLQIVLVGQPELMVQLNSPHLRQLKQRIGILCYLTSLDHQDCKEYISNRLIIAGCTDNQLFSQKAVQHIYKHSKGIPKVINILCDRALCQAYRKNCNRIDADIVEEVLTDYKSYNLPVVQKE